MPRLLDLFCGAGGAAMGYHRAGFEVVGVDIEPQMNYPFTFHQADAMTWPLEGFDAVHASPPCKPFTQMSAKYRGKGGRTDEHVDFLTPTLARFAALSTPWVVENVLGARALMPGAITLHGGMFGLGVYRPRLFASNVELMGCHAPKPREFVGVYGKPDGRDVYRFRNNGYKPSHAVLWPNRGGHSKSRIRAWKSVAQGAAAMGIDWMDDWIEVSDAIPPAYTEFIGSELILHARAVAAVRA